MKITSVKCDAAPIILIYGGEGRGKTSLATKFPKPVALLLERGVPAGITIDAIDGITTYEHVIESLRELIKDPQGYGTLIIDTVDALEPMLIADVCAKNNWRNIEQPSYGKGFVVADTEWQRFIRGITALRDRHGVTIVMVAHSTIERFDDPRAPSYTAYWPKLHKRARHLILDACDIVGFLAEDLHVATSDTGFRERTRAISNNTRFLFVEGCPAFVAKNRFAMPPKIAISADFNIGELAKYWQPNRNPQ
jgi:hypothetical protein